MTDRIYADIGKLIRARREDLAMTQEGLAGRVGLSRTSVTNVESGRQAVLVHQLVRFADALDVEVAALVPARTAAPNCIVEQVPADIAALVDKLSDRRFRVRT